MSSQEAAELIKQSSRGDTSPGTAPRVLVLDTRPFHDYCKSHIKDAINLSLPSTLSRRTTFTLEKCIQTLTSEERALLHSYELASQAKQPAVLIYDNFPSLPTDISPVVYHLARKFLASENCKSDVYVLQNGFINFQEEHEDLLASGSFVGNAAKGVQSDADTSLSSINETFSPSSQHFLSPQSLTSNASLSGSSANNGTVRATKSPLTFSRFTLPDVSHLPAFKARHNEELMNGKTDTTIHLQASLSPRTMEQLPTWLSNIYGTDMGATELSKKFNALQLQERERLNTALTHGRTATASPKVSSGFELGRKNRYKDILPYEHSRVKIKPHNDIKLPPIQTLKLPNAITEEQSYINASYLHYPYSKFHYIATQGPLTETVGDFWKVVNDHKVPIVISLTPEMENYVEKCAPFWVPGNYTSNGVQISVELIEQLEEVDLSPHTNPNHPCADATSTTFRHFKIQVGDLPPLHTLQVHVTSWPDHGVLVNAESLLGLVSLKTYVMQQLNIRCQIGEDRPIVVHCSAGSGRTGCFCCIDTAIDKYISNELEAEDDTLDQPVTPACEFVSKPNDKDLLYNITSSFRTQRVAVVQNLRQYILIYDTLIKFIETKEKANIQGELTPNGTLGHMLNGDIFTSQGLVDWQRKVDDSNNPEGRFIGNFLKQWF